MDLTDAVAPFEVRGTWYGRMRRGLNTLIWSLRLWIVVGFLPGLLTYAVLPGPGKPFAWVWFVIGAWPAVRWARRRTGTWSFVSPDGVVVHCHGRATHLAWDEIRRFEVVCQWASPVYIVAWLRDGDGDGDGDPIQIAATGGRSAEAIEHIVAYGQWATDGAWTPDPGVEPGNA
jgi:hypothetical protein